MYGKLRQTWELQQEQEMLSDQGFFDDVTMSDETLTSHKSLKQMTSISKLNVIPSSGMKQLWVEGNRIKVHVKNALHMYICITNHKTNPRSFAQKQYSSIHGSMHTVLAN